MQSAGLLPDGLEQLDLQESTGSGSPGRHNHHHQPRASDVLKLGDIVVLGSSRSIRGQIRCVPTCLLLQDRPGQAWKCRTDSL